jgi:hypothetical protein
MTTTKEKYYKMLFLTGAIYDIVLGIIFALFSAQAFALLGIANKLPQFGGYVSLIGAFLMALGCGYYLIYKGDLFNNRDLITVGSLFKLAYCLVAVVYLIKGDVPHMIFVWVFGVLDLVFFILMSECRLFLNRKSI